MDTASWALPRPNIGALELVDPFDVYRHGTALNPCSQLKLRHVLRCFRVFKIHTCQCLGYSIKPWAAEMIDVANEPGWFLQR